MRVFDIAGVLKPEQEQQLEEAIVGFQERTNFDFVVLISDETHSGKSHEMIADEFYANGSFGFDDEDSGILYYIDLAESYHHIATTGNVTRMLVEGQSDSHLATLTSYLSSGDYVKAIETLLHDAEAYGEQATMADAAPSPTAP